MDRQKLNNNYYMYACILFQLNIIKISIYFHVFRIDEEIASLQKEIKDWNDVNTIDKIEGKNENKLIRDSRMLVLEKKKDFER